MRIGFVGMKMKISWKVEVVVKKCSSVEPDNNILIDTHICPDYAAWMLI